MRYRPTFLVPLFMSAVGLLTLSAMAEPKLRIEQNEKESKVTFLSWDTEGGERAKTNLLRAPATGLSLIQKGQVLESLPEHRVEIPFDPRVTSTTVLSSTWTEDGS